MFMGSPPSVVPQAQKDLNGTGTSGHDRDQAGRIFLIRHCHGIERRFKPKTPATFGYCGMFGHDLIRKTGVTFPDHA
jgi:hypothetical protein